MFAGLLLWWCTEFWASFFPVCVPTQDGTPCPRYYP